MKTCENKKQKLNMEFKNAVEQVTGCRIDDGSLMVGDWRVPGGVNGSVTKYDLEDEAGSDSPLGRLHIILDKYNGCISYCYYCGFNVNGNVVSRSRVAFTAIK